MKKIVFLFAFFFCAAIFAQQRDYVNYTVQENESVKSIAKKFGLKYKQIYNLNPGLKRKPRANSVIILPNTPEVAALIAPVELEGAYVLHTVQPKETLFGIAQQYNVAIDSLKELNKELLLEGLKIGVVLSIPSEQKLTPEEEKEKLFQELDQKFELHTVVKDDTVYNLTKKYQVSEADLLTLNPALKEGLKLGMLLKIRAKENLVENQEPLQKQFVDSIVFKDTLKVGMLLPFKFTKNDTLTKEQLFTSRNNLISIITDFYLGAEMAIDSLRNKGVNIKVSVADTENDLDTIKQAIATSDFANSDVVFGPVFNKHVDFVARKLDGAPIVFPFYSSKQKSLKSANVVTTVTERSILKEKVLNYFSQIYTNEKVVIVGDEKLSSKKELIQIRDYLKEKHDSVKDVALLRPEEGYISKERFVEAVDTLGVNWVILATNDKVATADAINNLKSIPNDPEVRLFAFEKANNFDKVDNNLLADLNFVYASSGVKVDTSATVEKFYQDFYNRNNGFPSEYAVKGFDVVYDILTRLLANDSLNFESSIGVPTKRIRSSFHYEKDTMGNPIFNTAVYLRKYNKDLTIDIIEDVSIKEVLLDTVLKDTLHIEYKSLISTDSTSVNADKILLELED